MSSGNRREFLQAGLKGIAAASAGSILSRATAGKRRPNVLFIFSDQQRASTVSAYGGSPVRTPAIDRLAAQGCRFEHPISIHPVCSPYRAMLMSGLYPMRNGVVANDTPLPNDLPTFGKVFRDAGYRTGYIGKWHLEATRRGFIPESRRQGFDYWAVHSCNHKHFDSPYYTDDPDRELTHRGYEPDSQTELAIDFIRRQSRGADPFCLVLSFGPPHDPYKAPADYEKRFLPADEIPLPPNVNERTIVEELLRTDNRPLSAQQKEQRRLRLELLADDGRLRREVLVGYYAACEALDACVDRLLRALDEAGAADDTIVVYTSDHGDLAGSHRMISKQSPLEEAVRVPFVLRYPRAVPAGGIASSLLTPVDILPTLLALSGVNYDPERYDGRDLSAAATRADAVGPDAVPLMKLTHGGNPWTSNAIRPWRGVRTARYTYAEMEGAPWLLFDNQEDPHQLDNLIADAGKSGLRRRLARRMKELMAASGDTMTEREIDAFRQRQIQKWST